MPPSLTITIADVKPISDALVPTMGFTLSIMNGSGERADSCSLYCDVFMKVTEEDALKELYWGTMYILVPSVVDVGATVECMGRLKCTYDTDISVSKYLSVIGDEIPLKLEFYGSYTYPTSPFTGQIPRISKEYALPASRWMKMIHKYYRNIRWIAIKKDTLETLDGILEERELHTHDEVIKALLKAQLSKPVEK